MRRLHLAPLPEAEKRTLEELERHYPTPRVRRRATVVLMSQRGFDQTQIARGLGVSWSFVHRSVQRYQAQGFLGLMEHHPGGASKLTPDQIEQILHWIEQGPRAYHYTFAQWDTRSLQWRIRQVYNVQLSREAIRQLLHRHGFSWKRPKATYARVDPQARQQTQTELERLMGQARAGQIILLWQDEALASLATTLQCGWSRIAAQQKIPSLGKHDAAHRCAVFGAVDPIRGEVHYRIFPSITRTHMKRFVRHLKRFYRKSKRPVWMVMDNHGAHKRLDALWEEAGIHPYFLAPYCGDLNRIERLWAWLRQRQLHNVFFQNMAELKAAIRHFFCYIAGVKDQVRAHVA